MQFADNKSPYRATNVIDTTIERRRELGEIASLL